MTGESSAVARDRSRSRQGAAARQRVDESGTVAWREHMPAGMCLRSSTDWHLDAVGLHTFAAFVEDRGIAARDLEQTLQTRGWWQGLPAERQQAITREFWAAGQLTLEPWLTPRLPAGRVVRRPECAVTAVTATTAHDVTVRLSNGDTLTVDRVVFATGYASDLTRVPYPADLAGDIAQVDGHPRLDGGSQSRVPGLYFAGFAATRDFGPFFGFTKGCPAAASILVGDLLRQG